MTLSTTTVSQSYSGNGSTTAFTFTFPINSTSELKVIERSATGAETVKSEGTGSANYSIVDNGASGGTVTMVTAPASGTTLVLIRDTSLTQESDYVENDPFAAETHEDALDKLQMQIQEVQEEVDRSMKLSRTNTMTSTEFTNSATDRASKVLAFDSSGELSVTQELGTFKGDSATTTTAAYVIRDIVKSTTTAQLNNIYICIQASPIGTALTNTSYWTLIVDAVSAATSATTATTKASEAATSATNAAASYDSFDDRYLGAKSSDPSADNDGDGLLTGAIYFKTDGTGFKVYNGSAWKDIRPTDAQQTNIDTVAGANSNISALAASAVIADMALLATTDVIADMALLATSDVISDMNTLATSDIVSDINTLATSDIVSDLNTLATSDIVSDINTLATSDIVSDLNTLATSDFVSDLNTLAVSSVISDMNTLAGSGNAPSVTNVTASGTMQFGSLSDGTITITDFVDEDNMASNSAVKIPTQQSVKAYVDAVSTLSLIDEDNMATDSATRPPSQQSVKAFAESLTGTNIVATGALNAGTITSGFGNIDTGSSTITTTGAVATGALSVTGAISATAASTITTADNTDTLTLKSTDADGNSGPILRLNRDSGSPADGDVIGEIHFNADDDAGNTTSFFSMSGNIRDASNGDEDVQMVFSGFNGGNNVNYLEFDGDHVVFNEGSADIDFRVESNDKDHMLFVDGGGNHVLVDHTGSGVNQVINGETATLQVRGNTFGSSSLSISNHQAANAEPSLIFYKSRNTTPGSFTSIADNDSVGHIWFAADDGTDGASGVARIVAAIDGTPGANDTPGRMQFYTTKDGANSPIERMRINNAGASKHASGDDALQGTLTNAIHNFSSAANLSVLELSSGHASYSNSVLNIGAIRSAVNSYNLIVAHTGNGSSDRFNDLEFKVKGDGNVSCDESFSGSGADYSEYFEWSDGNSSDVDRVGISVKLNGNKIVASAGSDDAADIIGVVSGSPVIIGDADGTGTRWTEKYEKDDYGRTVYETYTITTWTEVVEDGDDIKHEYHTDRIPSDTTAPTDATAENKLTVISKEDDNTTNLTRRKLNSDYNSSLTYVARADRKEWDTVGLVGKLRMKKGQKTGTNWIKLRDISSDVEEWLVR